MLVEVRPLEIKKWHGKTGKESFSQPKTIEVLYDSNTGKLATGLTEEEAEKYGKILGLDLSDTFLPHAPHPYWSLKAAEIRLLNSTMIFDTSKPLDYVKVKNLKASKFVANSMKEYEQGLYPFATHVIFDETEEVAAKAGKIQLKNKANKLADKMSVDEKISIIQILSNKTLRGRSNDFVDVELEQILTERTEDFIRFAKMDKQEVYVRASVLEAIHKNILTKEGTAIYYMGEMLGVDFESTVEWFINPQNQKMKVSILEKLNS